MTGNPGRSEVKTLHNESERIYILRVWFTVMVLFIHSYSESVNFADGSVPLYSPDWWRYTKILLSNVVCMCAIPGFFFLSAFFLYRHPFGWIENLIRKIKRLVIPYLMINSFWIAVIFIAQHLPPTFFALFL